MATTAIGKGAGTRQMHKARRQVLYLAAVLAAITFLSTGTAIVWLYQTALRLGLAAGIDETNIRTPFIHAALLSAVAALLLALLGGLLLRRLAGPLLDQLSHSRRRYRAVVEDQTDLIGRWRPDGTRTFVNHAYCQFFGCSRREVLGSNLWETVSPEYARELRDLIARLTPEHPVTENEYRLENREGEKIWIHWRDHGLFDKKGRLVEIQSVGRDITERKKAVEALKQSERRLELALEGARVGLWEWPDCSRDEQWWSASYWRLLGYRPGELNPSFSQGLELVHPEDRQVLTEAMPKHLEDQGPKESAFRLRTRDGGYRWFRARAKVYRDPETQVVSAAGSLVDIDERVRAEESLRQSERRYRDLFEQSRDAIYISTREGRCLDVNPAITELFGYSREEMLQMDVATTYVDPKERRKFQEEIEREGSVKDYPLRVVRKDGRVLDCLLSSVVRRDEAGRVIGYQGIIRDVTAWHRAEERLRASEARFRGLFEHAEVGIALVGEGSRILDCNPKLSRMLGYTVGEMGALTVRDITFEEDRTRHRALEQSLLEGEIDRYQMQKRYLCKGGETLWARTTVSLIRGQDGRPRFSVAMVEDISQSREAELQRRMFELLVENSNDFIALADLEGRVLFLNEAGRQLVEMPEETVVGSTTISQYRSPEGQRASLEVEHPAVREVGYWRGMGTLRNWKTGQEIPVLVNSFLIRDPETGEPLATATVQRDISDLRWAEEAVRESEERYRSVIEAAANAIIVADAQMNILSWNRAAERMFGYSLSEIRARGLEAVVPGRLRAQHREAVRRVLEAGTDYVGKTFETRALRRDGSEFPIRSSLSSWTTSKGRFFSTIIEDLSEKHRLEEELRQSQRMESVGLLAGGIAHDFNNLLTGILCSADLALREAGSIPGVSSDLEQIRSLAEQAARLTRQLLAFSRRQALDVRLVSLNRLVEETLGMLGRIIGEDIVVRFQGRADPDTILADPGQIVQVLVNLAVNARDAMPGGGELEIATSNTDPASAVTPSVLLRVSDTGSGMDEGTRNRIFDPFFTTKDPGQGTGLGLSTAYGIVAQHEGEIRVESQPGQGTTFEIRLPAAAGEPEEKPAAAKTGERFGDSPLVLLVEDEEAVRGVLERTLNWLGCRVLSAASPAAARTLFDTHGPEIDLLLTDMVMPGETGLQLYRDLKQRRRDLKVLFTSGYSERADLTDLHKAGLPFISKPFRPSELARKIRRLHQQGPTASLG